MPAKVVITGMGIISSIGETVEENFDALIHRRSSISTLENFESLHKDTIKVGEIKHTDRALIQRLGLPEVNSYSRTSLLGIIAADEALKNAGIDPKKTPEVGLIMASSVGGMDMTERYFYQYTDNVPLRRYIATHNIGEVTHQIADYFALRQVVTSLSTACSSSANAIMTAAHLLLTGRAEVLLAGGADALSKFTINGFHSLMILSDTDCTPFDEHRKGLNLGEAAAFLVMETEESARKNGRTILAELSGWGNANDAYHQTASSSDGQGAYLSMQKALQASSLQPSQIDYVNAHGTATINNDLSESHALERIFGVATMPPFSSTKAYTGHTLAVASAVEAIYSILALREGLIWPNLNFTTPMSEVNIRPELQLKEKVLHHVLSNSFGFGGNCSTLVFSAF